MLMRAKIERPIKRTLRVHICKELLDVKALVYKKQASRELDEIIALEPKSLKDAYTWQPLFYNNTEYTFDNLYGIVWEDSVRSFKWYMGSKRNKEKLQNEFVETFLIVYIIFILAKWLPGWTT